MGEEGVLASQIGPGPWLKGLKLPGGIKPENFDYFHEMIAHEETARVGTPGFVDGISSGYSIGLPPVFNFGPAHLKERVVPEVLLGRKRICLAITEPYTGSDVAQIRTTAKRTPDGKHFIINGVKKVKYLFFSIIFEKKMIHAKNVENYLLTNEREKIIIVIIVDYQWYIL